MACSLAIALVFSNPVKAKLPLGDRPTWGNAVTETSPAYRQALSQAKTFRMPAEFEPIASIWMAYPTYENREGYPSQVVQEAMVKAIAPTVKIDFLLNESEEEAIVNGWLKTAGIPASQVRYHVVPHEDLWIRDMGPIFAVNTNQTQVVDFGFNAWSYLAATDPVAMTDEQVDRKVAGDLDLPILRSSLISEGGNREFNGKGTLMLTEAVELQRNPGLTKQEIETELKRVFNLKKVIWLKEGVIDDELSYRGKLPDGSLTVLATGGHIDEYARFVDPNTILLAEVTAEERATDPLAAINYQRLEENLKILQAATDQDGKPFRIVRIPAAKPIHVTMTQKDSIFQALQELTFEDSTVIQDDDQIKTILAASYLNFVIANDVVIIPSYWQPGRDLEYQQKDQAALAVFESVFPNKKIVMINPENINAGGGGMHCIVQQQAVVDEAITK
ncbi:agmatine deiminase family protein [Synechococcus elongatus]|nr:agmatine deiminase family protein [Synechococcus elongatus]